MFTAREIISGIDRLPSLPAVYARIRALVEDPDASLHDLADVIAADPVLTARTLAVVNSAFYGLSARVETVPRALALLGMRQIHDLALAVCLGSAFKDIDPAEADLPKFWRGSLYRAIVARQLAKASGLLDAERLFVEGLLSDVGELILYQALPQPTSAARKQAFESGELLPAVQRRVIGCDYAQVGAELLRRWGLPEAIVDTVRHHVEPARSATRSLEAAIVFVAAFAAGRHLRQLPLPVGAAVPASIWALIGVADDVLPAITALADSEAELIGALFLP